MKLISITCPDCGAHLQATANVKVLTCDYCNTDFMIDDELKHFCLQDAEQVGYEFEKGRQRALKELRADEVNDEKAGTISLNFFLFQWTVGKYFIIRYIAHLKPKVLQTR